MDLRKYSSLLFNPFHATPIFIYTQNHQRASDILMFLVDVERDQ